MITKDTLGFLGSLSSKICHDIVAPVSAIDMGISLLDDHISDSLKNDPAYKLLQESIARTLQKINFFRYALAFGKSDPPPSRREFIEHCENACAHFKINFILEEFTPPEVNTNFQLRLSACILYLLTETLPKGGTINTSISPSVSTFNAIGPLAIRSPSLDKINEPPTEDYRAQNILSTLIQEGLNTLGLSLKVEHSDTLCRIILTHN